MSDNFSSLMKDTLLQIQEVKQTQIKVTINQTTSDHITVKVLKTKGKKNIFKISREK